MKNVESICAILLAGAGLLLGSSLARADAITLTISSPFQTGGQGDVLDFYATVTNNSATQTVYLNGDAPTIEEPATYPTSPGLVLDDSPFLDNYPFTLAPMGQSGDSYSGLLFTVAIQPGTPYALYTGDFEILGGHYSSSEQFVIGSADFDVAVSPEPPTWEMLAMALMGLLVLMGWNCARGRAAM